ncbi:hypothetical protein PC129_g856 [Phytophthora cactorum]|uniref:RxLR effector protein n=1 Tax=Phytophthora cactorum TaxID=29920 RepID=A0A329SV16_9STRA|nr:hypothetical protein Pcac1_g2346 [Phytophthora cactorum]KAG2843239.1 hypothetical protein PC112_g2733 [Phytophthora cactorum]KAG2845609.1 hypothetical protein PC111_g1534 [Phytophthora cactorum]KAG2866718.1 hypothetical protein PC113_g2647 [Phytophthora cactorum]KAG2935551.1 hypothetical protein PC114_g579 [Phytophthora cactorum]
MRVGYGFLVAVSILVGSSDASTLVKAPTDEVRMANFFRSIETASRFLRGHEVTGDEARTMGAIASKVDELVDSAKLDSAMKDVTAMKVLFKQWNADAAISKQVIKRLSTDPFTFAKYNFLVLTYNRYRLEVLVMKLVDPKRLEDALVRNKWALFKQWNADETIAMRVIERLASDPQNFLLISQFNRYRTKVLENADKVV